MISKDKLQKNVDQLKNDTKSALQTMYDALNHGQQKKIVKIPKSRRSLTATASSMRSDPDAV